MLPIRPFINANILIKLDPLDHRINRFHFAFTFWSMERKKWFNRLNNDNNYSINGRVFFAVNTMCLSRMWWQQHKLLKLIFCIYFWVAKLCKWEITSIWKHSENVDSNFAIITKRKHIRQRIFKSYSIFRYFFWSKFDRKFKW